MNQEFIKLRQVRYRYSADREVLRGIDLKIPRGSATALIGPNGAGKTTLIRLIAGQLQPSSGDIEIDGTSLNSLSRREVAKRIAVVPQSLHADFPFLVEDLVMMGRYPHVGALRWTRKIDRDITAVAMRTVGISHLYGRQFAQLSGGEQQLVLIAAALAQQADIILLDEPSAHLDLGHKVEVLSRIAKLRQSKNPKTIIFVSHDFTLVPEICSEVVIINEGRLVQHAPIKEAMTEERIREIFACQVAVDTHPVSGNLRISPIISS